jgi:hypothetical protein
MTFVTVSNFIFFYTKNKGSDTMGKVNSLISRIDEARGTLNKLIESNNDLINPKVVKASKNLDTLLNLYSKCSNQNREYIKLCL